MNALKELIKATKSYTEDNGKRPTKVCVSLGAYSEIHCDFFWRMQGILFPEKMLDKILGMELSVDLDDVGHTITLQ